MYVDEEATGYYEDATTASPSIHHVESYAARPTEGYCKHSTYLPRNIVNHEFPYDSDEYYDQATKWGAEVLEKGQSHPSSRHQAAQLASLFADSGQTSSDVQYDITLHQYESVGLPGGSAGGVFPYDYDLRKNKTIVQLIVGEKGKTDAGDLLNSSDLAGLHVLEHSRFDSMDPHTDIKSQ